MSDVRPIHNLAEFRAAFPDDAVLSPSGDIDVPAGKAVADCIVAALRAKAIVAQAASQHEFYGWRFTAQHAGHIFWFILQYAEPYILECGIKRSLWDRLRRKPNGAAFSEMLKTVDDILKGDPQFNNINWYTSDEYIASKRRKNKPV